MGRIKADDPDVGRNAEMEYSIVGGHDIFNIITDQKTQEGVIVIKKVDPFVLSGNFNKNTHPRMLLLTPTCVNSV